ncbi:helix-turn-helix domain-containing protein [Gemmobacter lanyuensis]
MDLDLRIYLRDIEVSLIEAALGQTAGCVTRAAEALRLRRTTLIEKMKKYGIAAAAI